MKEKTICRGDLFYYDFGTRTGSVQSGTRGIPRKAVFNIVKSQICDESDCIMGLSQKNEYTDAINTRRTKCKAKKKCH